MRKKRILKLWLDLLDVHSFKWIINFYFCCTDFDYYLTENRWLFLSLFHSAVSLTFTISNPWEVEPFYYSLVQVCAQLFIHSLLNNNLTHVYYISELVLRSEHIAKHKNRHKFQVSQSLQCSGRASSKILTTPSAQLQRALFTWTLLWVVPAGGRKVGALGHADCQ